MGKMTETMWVGLAKMQAKHDRGQETVIAEPNDNTGRALERRGLVEFVKIHCGWARYRVTTAGRSALEEHNGK